MYPPDGEWDSVIHHPAFALSGQLKGEKTVCVSENRIYGRKWRTVFPDT